MFTDMAWLCRFLSLLFIVESVVSTEDCIIDNNSLENSWEHQLSQDLFKTCNYDVRKPPPSDTKELIVNVTFILKNFHFYNNEETLSIYNWVFIIWFDDRLKWDPKNYNGIDQLQIPSWKIWSPNLEHRNRIDPNKIFDSVYRSCLIMYTGKIKCMPRLIYETECITNLKNWPYDTQNCTFHFGAWNRPFVKITFNFKDIAMLGAEYGAGWTIVGQNTMKNPNKTEQFSLSFKLQREAIGVAIAVVFPSIITCILTIASLTLNLGSLRLFMSSFSLSLHFFVLLEISELIPHHGSEPPSILLYVRTSAFLALLALTLSCFLSFLKSLERPVPMWINSLNKYVLDSKLRLIIWPKWMFENGELTISENLSNKVNSEEWLDFANILNTAFIVSYILVYVIITAVYVPKNPPIV